MAPTTDSPVRIIDTRAEARPDGKVLDLIEGAAYKAGVSIILEDTDVVGSGPASISIRTRKLL